MDATICRITLEVGGGASSFYGTVFGEEGRSVGGGRVYFDCGPVVLALLEKHDPSPLPEHVYFAVNDLDVVYARAKTLGALSKEVVHGSSAAEIVKRPWGERSFYVEDPWKNKLCFVDERTLFTGRELR